MLAVEVTTATLTAWGAAAVLVGFALGWLLRPWAMADRISREQTEIIERQATKLASTEVDLASVSAQLDTATADVTSARAEVVQLRQQLDEARASLASTEAKLTESEARAEAAARPGA